MEGLEINVGVVNSWYIWTWKEIDLKWEAYVLQPNKYNAPFNMNLYLYLKDVCFDKIQHTLHFNIFIELLFPIQKILYQWNWYYKVESVFKPDLAYV